MGISWHRMRPAVIAYVGGRGKDTLAPYTVCGRAVRLGMRAPPVSLGCVWAGPRGRNRFPLGKEIRSILRKRCTPNVFFCYAVYCVNSASRRRFRYACVGVKPEARGLTEKAVLRSKVRNRIRSILRPISYALYFVRGETKRPKQGYCALYCVIR